MRAKIGDTFNSLTIIGLVEQRKRGATWRCRCVCGTELDVKETDLTTGHKKSCGCLKRNRSIDMCGQVFGYLTVIEKVKSDKSRASRSARWRCQCICGNFTEVSRAMLINGEVKSCGCKAQNEVIDMVGQTFGRLTVISRTENTPNGCAQWLCRCSCGTEKIILGHSLRSGLTRSCGCIARDMMTSPERMEMRRKYNRYVVYDDVTIMYTNNDVSFLIDTEDLDKVLHKACWSTNKKGYLNGRANKQIVWLHRYLMNCPDDLFVDHINGVVTDNRKSNLRIVTQQQNSMNHKRLKNNTSGYNGVCWDKRRNKWHSRIVYKTVCYDLGHYTDIADAIIARKCAEVQYYGEYRREEE